MTFHLNECSFPRFTQVYLEEISLSTRGKTLKTTISQNKGTAVYDLEFLMAGVST